MPKNVAPDPWRAKKSGDGYVARCLFAEKHANGDADPSMSIFRGDDGEAMLHCKVGLSSTAELMAEARKRGLISNGTQATGAQTASGKRRIVKTYPYPAADGNLLFEVVRYEPIIFSQRQLGGEGGWVWNLKGVDTVLFNLPEVLAAKAEKTIIVTEGEEDALALQGLGFTATCNPGGAGKWKPQYTETLRGARIIAWGDNDEPGRKHAAMVARELHGAAKSVRIIYAPDGHKDAADWISAGATADDIRQLATATPEWEPDTVKDGSLILDPRDPLPNARAFIAEHFTRKESRILLHQDGEFRAWNGTCYPARPESEIRANLYEFLEAAQCRAKGDALIPYKPTRARLGDALDALRAVANLPGSNAGPLLA